MQFSYVSLVLNNAAHNLAVLKDSGTEVSGFGQNFIVNLIKHQVLIDL